METFRELYEKLSGKIRDCCVTAGLASVLLFGATSCGETTPEDVYKQGKKVENISNQIEVYKRGYRDAANEYNRLLKARKDSNKESLDLIMKDQMELAQYYGGKIEELGGKRVKERRKEVDMEAECSSDYYHPGWNYIDPNRYEDW